MKVPEIKKTGFYELVKHLHLAKEVSSSLSFSNNKDDAVFDFSGWVDIYPKIIADVHFWKAFSPGYAHFGWTDTKAKTSKGASHGVSYSIDKYGTSDMIDTKITSPLSEYYLKEATAAIEELNDIITHTSPKMYNYVSSKVHHDTVLSLVTSSSPPDIGCIMVEIARSLRREIKKYEKRR